MSNDLISGYDFGQALKDAGYPLPQSCRNVIFQTPTTGVVTVTFECYARQNDLLKLSMALSSVSSGQHSSLIYALRDVEYPVPEECNNVSMSVHTDGAFVLTFECNVLSTHLPMISAAMKTLSE